jgi:hypothetical protein
MCLLTRIVWHKNLAKSYGVLGLAQVRARTRSGVTVKSKYHVGGREATKNMLFVYFET